MALTNLSQITTSGISTLADINLNNITGVAATFTGNVTIGGTLTYDDVTNIDSVGLITARSGVSITGGDLTLPDAIVHAGDTNTKIRFPAADTVTVETGGSERLRINSNGTIGSGVTGGTYTFQINDTDSSCTLQLTNNTIGNGTGDGTRITQSTSGILYIENQENSHTILSTSATERLRITSGGKVGIGLTNPFGQLQVRAGTNANFSFSTGGGESSLEILNDAGSANVPLNVRASEYKIKIQGNEKVRITSTGMVGISTTAAQITSSERLSVFQAVSVFRFDSATTAPVYLRNGDFSNANNPYLVFQDTAGNRGGIGIANNESAMYIHGQNGTRFRYGGTQPGTAEAMRITSDGNVLVGTTDATIYNNGDSDSEGIVLRNGEVIDIARKGDLQLTLNRQTNDGHHIGFFRSGSPKSYISTRNNAFCIDVNSSERLRITSAGDMGLGTTSPTNFSNYVSFTLNGTTGGNIEFKDDNVLRGSIYNLADQFIVQAQGSSTPLSLKTNSLERLRITSDGKVGIGIATPNQELHIHAQNGTSYIQFTDESSGTAANDGAIFGLDHPHLYAWNYEAGDFVVATNATERLRIKSNGVIQMTPEGATTAPNAAFDTTGDNFRIYSKKDGTDGIGLIFSTQASGGSLVERIRIATNGKTGINESSPSTQLHIKGSNNILRLETTASTGTNYMEFYDASARKGYIGYGSGSSETYYFVNEEVGNFSFYTNQGSGITEKVVITDDGMMGVGMTPQNAGGSTYMMQLYNGGAQCYLSIGNGTSGGGPLNGLILGNDTLNSYLYNREATGLKFGTSNADRMMIDADGHVRFGGSGDGFDSAWAHNTYGNTEVAIDGSGGYGVLHFRGDGAGTVNTRYSMGVGDEKFYMAYDDVAGAHRLEITNSGKLVTGLNITMREGNSNSGEAFRLESSGANGYFRLVDVYDGLEIFRIHGDGAYSYNTTNLSNYGQTASGYSTAGGNTGNWSFRRDTGAVVHATDADSGWSNMYMNKYDWSSGKDSRWINFYLNGGGQDSITWNGSNIVYGTSSDYRIKKNVRDFTGGIDKVKQLKVRIFDYIDTERGTDRVGFIAHELQEVVPEAVEGEKDAMRKEEDTEELVPAHQSVEYGKITPLLASALQEAIAKIEILEAEVKALKG